MYRVGTSLETLIFTLLAYPMGNFVPELVPGARGAAFSGLWIHDAIGLFVTPLAVAILYFVIPAATRKPIFSHFLSMLGFWLLFFLYPLNGTHHYIFSVIPMTAQIGAITALNLAWSGRYHQRRQSAPVTARHGLCPARYRAPVCGHFGCPMYLIVSIQGFGCRRKMSVNQSIHFRIG